MRAPMLAIAVAGALLLGGAAAVAAAAPATTQPPAPPGEPVDDMRQMHEQMLRDYPEMGTMHERMMGGS